MKTRREFLIAGGAGLYLLTAPLTSLAQQKTYRIAILSGGSQVSSARSVDTFLDGLRDLGYVQGKNVSIERRHAEGNFERLPALAIELVQSKPDVILALSSVSVQAVRKATTTIPVVMTAVGNPVGSGFVASLARPGGNITGLSNVSIEVSAKYLELLQAALPRLSRVALLIDPEHPNHPTVLKQVQATAKQNDIKVLPFEVRAIGDTEKVLHSMMREQPGALIVPPDSAFSMKARQIAEFAVKMRLPTMFGSQTGVEVGGLMGYQANLSDMYRRAATMVDKILKGTRPGDIPVELPTRFDLVVNQKTAKAIGVTIPQSILVRADRVIE